MKKFKTMADIDTTVDEGKLLVMALERLATQGRYQTMTFSKTLKEIVKMAKAVYPEKRRSAVEAMQDVKEENNVG